jgi:type I restriction enzyme, S subunit
MKSIKLGEIASFQAGYGFPIKLQGRLEGDYPFAKVGDISAVARSGQQYISTAKNYVNDDDLPILRAKILPKGTIVFAKIGEAIKQNFRAITTCQMLVDNNTMGMIPHGDKVDTNYLFHFMCKLDLYRYTGATTVPAIRKSTLESIEIPLPPLPEQKRIAAILDKADVIRRKRRQAIQLADDFLRATFLDMFGDPVTNPKGWEVKPLNNFATFENGDRSSNYPSGDDLKQDGVLFVSTKNIVNNSFSLHETKFISEEKFESLSRGKLRKGDLIITLRGTLGS